VTAEDLIGAGGRATGQQDNALGGGDFAPLSLHDQSELQQEQRMLQQLQESVVTAQPLSVVVAHDDKHPKRRFKFHSRACTDSASKASALVISEHCDGAKFCERLFGHFLLPNGRLAHFYYRVRFQCS
jgi:hypothetical protein